MTNYSQRLDEILEHLLIDYDFDVKDKDSRTFDRATQAITSLIKELVAEVKPAMAIIYDNEMRIDRARKSAANHATDQFEQNILKALEEK